ncbi:alkaline phosphatase synthesis sensor protein PhoR [Vibrio campbellii ATCC BAA-1116]|uniref:PepSY domain-containing protein n=1 Tax=Vibrio campbellii TaxID=680 RepID=UPI00039214B2|nr:alkaline phosphatase synthesis sensor protein PhoR [Vibrio campbellii]AGU93717.1 alkaline phosphatase synthesis sensor protein PhoR [Vibrio campbellii ATCC BAA-1116]
MSISFTPRKLSVLLAIFPLLLSAPSFADHHDHKDHHDDKDGHAIVRDVEKPGTRIEFDEDHDEVYRAVQKGYIRPFSDMYAAVENDLYGRIIKVELEEDDNEWVYELKILFNDSVIKVEYDAATLEMLEIKGRNFNKALKPQ